MTAQKHFSHKELHGKNTKQMLEMLSNEGFDWNIYKPRIKIGGFVRKNSVQKYNQDVSYIRDGWLVEPANDFKDTREDFLKYINSLSKYDDNL